MVRNDKIEKDNDNYDNGNKDNDNEDNYEGILDMAGQTSCSFSIEVSLIML